MNPEQGAMLMYVHTYKIHQREREREGETDARAHTHMYTYEQGAMLMLDWALSSLFIRSLLAI
jgi:hypothetical protein